MALGETYEEFVEKFEVKKTTDDCYTPPIVYSAIADYVADKFGLDRSKFVRPFFPGGDYEAREYAPDEIVVDNPPFSILSKIVQHYMERGVRFWLFAPTLTLFSCSAIDGVTAIPCGCSITYDNGARVNTSFVTNLDDPANAVRVYPDLYGVVKEADERSVAEKRKAPPKYDYPAHLLTAARCEIYAKYGAPLVIRRSDTRRVHSLEAQRPHKKSIFGGGYLLSEKAARARIKAEEAVSEAMKRERADTRRAVVWPLSDRERAVIDAMS